MALISLPARALGTLTSTGLQVTAADTVTIGGVVYTYRAAVGTTANEVLMGANAAAAVDNLKAAINVDPAGSGVTYGSLTVVNPHVIATTNTDTTQVVESKVRGAVGNFIATTEAAVTLSWGAATLASGADSLNDAIETLISDYQLSADVSQILRELSEGGITG